MEGLTLNLSVKKPLTPAEWLRSSVGWTLGAIASWFMASSVLYKLLDTRELLGEVLLFGLAVVAHVLIWYKAVLSSWDTVAAKTEPLWLNAVSAGWTFVLLFFQLACLGILFLLLALACDTSSSCWN